MTLPSEARRVVLLCGPPGAGKTTWARDSGLRVYDRDDPQWRNEKHFTAATRHLRHDPRARAVVIRSGARWSSRARAASRLAATEVVVLDVPADECIRRVTDRARHTQPISQQIAAVRAWWAKYEPTRPDRAPDPRVTHAYKVLARTVVREEPLCKLRLPGCTRWTTTADHVLPVKTHPELAMLRSNLQGACKHCNSAKQDRNPSELRKRAAAQPAALDWFDPRGGTKSGT